jgi:6-phosphofructokinase 1
MAQPILGIICGGGPVPGLNDLITAIVLSAREAGWRILGFHDGFRHLATGDAAVIRSNTVDLTDAALDSPILIRSDRFDPGRKSSIISTCASALLRANIRYLLVIGGNTQLLAAELITDGTNPTDLQLLIIPKTVDNDVPLPNDGVTVGFHSARQLGLELMSTLIQERRGWLIVETSGRRTGHLPFELVRSSGADVAVIPEDFVGRKLELGDLCDLIEGSILKKLTKGEVHGVCVIADGLVHLLSAVSLKRMEKEGWIPREADGLELGKANLSAAIVSELKKRFEARTVNIQIEARSLVHKLRSAPQPTSNWRAQSSMRVLQLTVSSLATQIASYAADHYIDLSEH